MRQLETHDGNEHQHDNEAEDDEAHAPAGAVLEDELHAVRGSAQPVARHLGGNGS